jgi:hypothetical protein
MLHMTKGGSSETDEKLLAVMPSGPTGVWVVTIVTPVVNRPNAFRSGRVSSALGIRTGDA